MPLQNILFVVPSLGGGGAEMNAVRLSHPLQEAGVLCTYASLSSENEYRAKLHPDAEVVVLADSSKGSSTWRQLRTVPALAGLLRSRRFDAIIPVLEVPALMVALARKVAPADMPMILSVQNAFLRTHRNSRSIKARVMRWLSILGYGQADGAITLTRGVGRDLAEYVPALTGRIRTVNNVGLMDLRNGSLSLVERRVGALRIVACGRLTEVKDYPTLLEAFARVIRSRDAYLDIVGDGPLRATLEAQARELGISERTTFHGFVPDPERIMADADIFVLTSTSEGFGNVIVEAMALGLPVVATNCPYGPGEILGDSEYGLLAPVGQPGAVAEKIGLLADDRAMRKRFSELGRKRAADFTPEAIGRQFHHALQELCDSLGRR